MIGKLAFRSLAAHPARSAVLAAGFGIGVAVMAVLLGVAEIVLEQAQAPALVGGGDVLIRLSPEVPARVLMSGTLQSDALRGRIRAANPSHTSPLFLLHEGRSTPIAARGGIPSRERMLADEETAAIAEWRDLPEDVAWTQETPEQVLAYIDRFHAVPDAPAWSDSWAEWLYFNGRSSTASFYLTFLTGPVLADGRRSAGVWLQLDRGRGVENFTGSQPITPEQALNAPNLDIAASSVRLDGLQYRLHLDLSGQDGSRLRGDLTIDALPGQLVPPLEITGARGWRSGYVVPVMSGRLNGTLDVGGERVVFDGGSGYHDHNWGFWQGVSWQWGQVRHDEFAILFGRVFPPVEAADPDRVRGFLGVLGPDGPIAYARNVSITETNDEDGRPQSISVLARGRNVRILMDLDVDSTVTTRMNGPLGSGLDFLQLGGNYTVSGRAGDRMLDFTSPGTAETFRGQFERP
jgi:hypothetical protein